MNETIKQPITETLEKNYLPYAMSVILSRALPEIDGLKPAHRKLLYTMYKMGLLKGAKTKCANIVGQTMKLNPHGDEAIYQTLVRMAKGNESLLHPYVDSKGNFGKVYSRDVSYAASRYTEAKLETITEEMFAEIDKDTVDFEPNYDGTLYEPTLLPVRFPTILVNPNKGIAVGMASNICSFNLGEIIDATIHYIKNPKVDLLKYIHGPDFPTGGSIIYDEDVFHRMMEEGTGTFKIRGRMEYIHKGNVIEITEIPYTTTIEAIIEKTISLIKAGTLKEISDIRDESDLNGLKIAIDLKRSADPDQVMARLYRDTPLEDTFSCNFNVLVNAYPCQLGVRDILKHWLDFRVSCIRRSVRYDLGKFEEKLHLIQGLKNVLLDIDAVIKVIRETELEKEVVPNLMKRFMLDEVQAEFVANIKLRNINREFITNRIAEEKDLLARIEEAKALYDSDQLISELIIQELKEIKRSYGLPRKSQIVTIDEVQGDLDLLEEIEQKVFPFVAFLTRDGYFKAIDPQHLEKYPEQRLKDSDEIVSRFPIDSEHTLLFFTNKHNVYKLQGDQVTLNKSSELGVYLSNELELELDEHVIYMAVTKDFSGHMLFAFENGKLSKVPLSSYETKTRRRQLLNAYFDGSPLVMMAQLEKDTDILVTRLSNGKEYILLVNTALIPEKSSRNNQGVQVTRKTKGSLLTDVTIPKDPTKLEKYRVDSIPKSGTARIPLEGGDLWKF
ncbi:DNA gyrase subunit A [Guggenheimella bovis]